MKKYNEKKQGKYASIKKKLLEEAMPKTILIPSIKDDIKKIKEQEEDKRKQQK